MNKLHAYRISELKVVEPNEEKRDNALAALRPFNKSVAKKYTCGKEFNDAFMRQPDLLYIEAVLVSEGINDNDDAFTHRELWDALQTPILKPINVGHKDSNIVGVMYGAEARSLSGETITEDNGEPFEIIMHGVVWHYLPHLRGVAVDIAEKHARGSAFVSMECWFEGYDYGLYDHQGNMVDIIKRNDDTANLESHLRVCGGSGKFNNMRIGRALNGITFGGVAFVDVPANRRSDVLNVFLFDPQAEEVVSVSPVNQEETELVTVANSKTNNVVPNEEGFMNDATNKAVAQNADVRKVTEEVLEARDKIQAQKEAEAKATEATKRVAELESELKAAQTALANAHETVDAEYEIAKANATKVNAGATSNTPVEISRIDRAKDGEEAFKAKIAFIAQTRASLDEATLAEIDTVRAENEALKAQVREQVRTAEIHETFAGILTDEELADVTKRGLAKSDEDYVDWLEEKKLFARKMYNELSDEEVQKVKIMREKDKGKDKGKARYLVPANETEKLKDHDVSLRSELGKVPGSVPSVRSLASEDLSEHFEEVSDNINLDGATAGTDEDQGDPFEQAVAKLVAVRSGQGRAKAELLKKLRGGN